MASGIQEQEAPARASVALPPRGPRSQSEEAYLKIRDRIVSLDLAPGSVVNEARLQHELNIGRTPIREALQRLAREGLVRILPRKGIQVSETDPRKQLLVLEVRRELERLLCRLGAERGSEEQRKRFRAIADGMDRAAKTNDDLAFLRLDRELNLLISEAAHNDHASGAMRVLHGHSRRFWYMHYRQAADLPLCARLHAAQARAIADGDAKRACEASDRLIDYTETFTRATVGANPRPPAHRRARAV